MSEKIKNIVGKAKPSETVTVKYINEFPGKVTSRIDRQWCKRFYLKVTANACFIF